MRIFWIRIPKELQWIVAFSIMTIGVAIYSNLALIVLLILLGVFLGLFLWWLMKYLDDYQWGTDFDKTIWIILMVLSLVPGYFSWYIMYSYDESNKYLQEQSIGWLVEIWKFAVSGRRFTTKNILRVVENNLNDTLKEEATKSMIDNLAKNPNWKTNIPTIEPNMTIQSWSIHLDPVIK